MNKRLPARKGSGMHFSKIVAAASLFFVACAAALGMALGRYNENDKEMYHKLMHDQKESEELISSKANLKSTLFFAENSGSSLKNREQNTSWDHDRDDMNHAELSDSVMDIDRISVIEDGYQYSDVEENSEASIPDLSATPLVVKSRCMAIQLAAKDANNDHTSRHISLLTADEQVTVNYNNDFIATADHATYQHMPATHGSVKALGPSGLIIMTAEGESGICQIANQQGDIIKASQISIDTSSKQLAFVSPEGVLKSHDNGEQGRAIEFTADTLVWDDIAGVLTFQGNVEIDQQGMGNLKTPQQVRCYQNIIDNKKTLKGIKASGDTILTYCEEDGGRCRTLTCSGPVKVDHEKMETCLMAERNASGQITEECQVHFQDDKGEMFADRVFVKYAACDGSITLNKIVLLGNVKIYNRLHSADDEKTVIIQYVLADRVDFMPKTNEMLLRSTKAKRRVLFFDKANNLQVSAQALSVVRDKATKKDAIKGVGDVRFSFLESEFEQLKQRFSLDALDKAITR